MLAQIHQKDSGVFEHIVSKIKTLSYSELLKKPEKEQLSIPELSHHTTIEFTKNFCDIDRAMHIVLTQFLWLSVDNDPNLISGMHNVEIPMPNPNPDLYYSGHCMTEFFYALEDGTKTDDIFIRNDLAEEIIIEDANWFGQTGLSIEEERGLPRFMRYEYGDLLVDDDGLKAHDLKFLGEFKLNPPLFKKLKLEIKRSPKSIYAWHYYDDHYAFAYHDEHGDLHYDLGSYFPIADCQLTGS